MINQSNQINKINQNTPIYPSNLLVDQIRFQNLIDNSTLVQPMDPSIKLYYGGYQTTESQLNFIDYVFYRFFIKPDNCFQKHLLSLEIIYDTLKNIPRYNHFDLTPWRIISFELYRIGKDRSYEIPIDVFKIFGNYEKNINSEEAVIENFVNLMTHVLMYREYDKDKVLMFLEFIIQTIKQDITYQNMVKSQFQY